MSRQAGLLAIAVTAVAALFVAAGTAFDRHRRRERPRLARPEINRWEEEGGAIPTDSRHTAAQTRSEPQTF